MSQTQSPPEASTQTFKIVWAALTFSILIYAVVAVLVPGPEEPTNQVLPIALMGMACIAAALAMIGIPSLFKPTKPEQLFTFFIIQWALCEAVATFGLVSHLSGGPTWSFWSPLGLSVLLMLMLYPSDNRIDELTSTMP